jgi:hypothetical protein
MVKERKLRGRFRYETANMEKCSKKSVEREAFWKG